MEIVSLAHERPQPIPDGSTSSIGWSLGDSYVGREETALCANER